LPDNPTFLKNELKKYREFAHSQHLLLKKMKMELDLESGRVKILRHDNEQLRKSAVDLVPLFLKLFWQFLIGHSMLNKNARKN
jgi:hypothetical protein